MLRAASWASLVLLLVLPAAAAQGSGLTPDPSPNAPNAVRSAVGVRVLESLDAFEVTIHLDVHEIELAILGPRSASELRATPEAVRVLIERELRERMVRETHTALPGTVPVVREFRAVYGEEDIDGDPYHPAVRFEAVIHAKLTLRSFGLPAAAHTTTEEAARAVLQSGGVYRAAGSMAVPPGHEARYRVEVPPALIIESNNTAGLVFESRKDNMKGAQAAALPLGISVRMRPEAMPPNVQDGPLLHATMRIDEVTPLHAQIVPTQPASWRAALDLEARVASVRAGELNMPRVPARLELEHFSADLLRIAVREDVVDPVLIEAYFQDALARAALETLGEGVEVRFDRAAFQESLDQPLTTGSDPVRPLIIRGTTEVVSPEPRMFAATGAGRLLGAVFGAQTAFEITNSGPWDAHLQVLYPRTSDIEVKDSAGHTRPLRLEGRQGFEMVLAPGDSTRIDVGIRDVPSPLVMGSSVLQFVVVGVLLRAGFRHSKIPPEVAEAFSGEQKRPSVPS